MDVHYENLQMCPIREDQNEEQRQKVIEENPYQNFQTRREEVQERQSEVDENLESDTTRPTTNPDSVKNEKNNNCDKYSRIAIALLAVSVLVALIMSAASMAMLMKFYKEITQTQKSIQVEMKEVKNFFHEHQKNIQKSQIQDLELNRSLNMLSDQANRTQDNILAEITEMKKFQVIQELKLNRSLALLGDKTNRTQEKIRLQIRKMRKFHGFQNIKLNRSLAVLKNQTQDNIQAEIREIKALQEIQNLKLNKSLAALRDETNKTHEKIRLEIQNMTVLDERRESELNQILIKIEEQIKRTEENNAWEIRETRSYVEKNQAGISKFQIQDLMLNRSLTFLQDQFISLKKNATISFSTTEETIDQLRSTINETRAESNALSSSYQSLTNTTRQHGLRIERLYELVDGIRLVGSSRNYRGRVEIVHNGQWGTICDDGWDINDATVVCRMLGYRSASSAYQGAAYGEGTGKIWLENVACSGTESTIYECVKGSWGIHHCTHSKDASVACNI